MLNIKLCLMLCIALYVGTTLALELSALQYLLIFLGCEDFVTFNANQTAQIKKAALGPSRGVCNYNFVDIVTYRYERECAPDDKNITHLLPKRNVIIKPKPPIMVKCLEQPATNTSVNATLQIIESVKDVVALLKPNGNATKRHEPGSCVLVFFYTETSLGCSMVAPYANRLPRLFPSLRVAAIDAYKFPSFNTEFGIVGLPTLLLFHQGRPIVKFYSEELTYGSFVTRHTGIQPVEPVGEEVKGPLPVVPVQKPDYYLVLAWSFILLCLGNYFAKSVICKQIIEMIQRNWRESEAQLEHS